MKIWIGYLRLFCVLTIASGFVAVAAHAIEIPREPSERPRLKGVYSREHDLAELKAPDAKALVFAFVDVDCPVAQQYLATLKKLSAEFGARGVRFYGIYPKARVDVLKLAAHAHDNDIGFPVFLDQQRKLATLLDVSVTPEVVVLDGQLSRQYQGAIDNQFSKRGSLPQATRHYLKDALEQLLDERTIAEPFVPASGCPLEPWERLITTKSVTYHKDVAPILQRNCQGCHRPGGVGPFSLLTYNDAYYNAERISEAVGERRMPPWHGYLNSEFGRFKHAKNLTEEEIETLVGWAEQDAPPGDAKDAPTPIKWPQKEEWGIGKPDYVYRISKPFAVPKHGIIDYQFFRVKLDFKEDRWFNAVEVKPGNASVVHHIGLHIVKADDREYKGFGGMAALYGLNNSARLINDYVPGDSYNAKTYPAGQAVRIPQDSDLVFEVHYTPNNRAATTDQSMVAFKWAAKPPAEEVLTKVFRKPVGRFRIPPHDHHYQMQDAYYFEQDVYVDAVRPHFHLRGKSFRLEIIKRNAQTDEVVSRETILTIPIYDADWQRTYELETPLLVEAGVELVATSHFDNSKFNPRNPDPNTAVLWGQQSSDEMFSVRFKYHLADEAHQER